MENNQLTEEQLVNNAYLKLWDLCKVYLPDSSEANLHKAFLFAKKVHSDQRRKSGEPYILHPIAVAELLTEYCMDETSIVAAILHDVVEDSNCTVEEIEKQFGSNVALLVDGLTKLSKIKFRSSEEKLAENFRKMILAMSKDIRVLIVKLADRTHNMRTIRALSAAKRRSIAEETIEIHAPLAGRLGMHKIKAELEDLSFREIKPAVYYSLISKIKQKRQEREIVVDTASSLLLEKIKTEKISAQVYGRAKHFYSIYKKISEKKMEFEDIYDLLALRVIVKTVAECYEVLGIIHSLYTPVPGRFKDYIALPKANLYQSLHTTVVAAKGELLEIQIRTEQMHDIAENGIAAHWLYKEIREKGGQSKDFSAEIEKFSWIKQMLSHEKEIKDPNEFLETVKVDLFDDEVYVFTPRGDVFALKKGATYLDFAFAVHTDIGLKTTGVKVNGRIASVRGRLYSGDVVEVITANKPRATKDWLNFVQTSKARSRIKAYLASLTRETETQTQTLPIELPKQQQRRRPTLQPGKTPEEIITVQGLTGILVNRAKCCAPLPDQPIIGFVARAGKGIMVHAANCRWAFLNNPGRRVECSWNNKQAQGHEVILKVSTHDKPGVLAGITNTVSSLNMNIASINCHTNAQKRAVILLKLELQTLEALNSVHQNIEAVDGVLHVERI